MNNKPDPPEDDPEITAPEWDEQTDGKIVSRPAGQEYQTELLKDLNFSRGFNVTLFHSNSSAGQLAGKLDYGGNKADGDPVWTMAQWGCRHDMVEAPFTRSGPLLTYEDAGRKLSVNAAKTGSVVMGIKGSEEYTRDEEGNVRERTEEAENWPHILIEQSIGHDISPGLSHLYMEVEYKVTKCESLVDREKYPLNPNLNAAQFQWFITLTDIKEGSVSFGRSMWFGFSMFDTRSLGDTPAAFNGLDGGKEDSTGLYIYMPSLKQVANNKDCSVPLPTSVVGETRRVKVDILPYLKMGLKLAAQENALLGADVDHLRIGSTNIGWEIPGNYDAEVEISYLNMYEV